MNPSTFWHIAVYALEILAGYAVGHDLYRAFRHGEGLIATVWDGMKATCEWPVARRRARLAAETSTTALGYPERMRGACPRNHRPPVLEPVYTVDLPSAPAELVAVWCPVCQVQLSPSAMYPTHAERIMEESRARAEKAEADREAERARLAAMTPDELAAYMVETHHRNTLAILAEQRDALTIRLPTEFTGLAHTPEDDIRGFVAGKGVLDPDAVRKWSRPIIWGGDFHRVPLTRPCLHDDVREHWAAERHTAVGRICNDCNTVLDPGCEHLRVARPAGNSQAVCPDCHKEVWVHMPPQPLRPDPGRVERK